LTRALEATLLRDVDPARAAVRPFDGFVFVCGGSLSPHPAGHIVSIRQFAIARSVAAGNSLANCKVIVAERVTELLRDGSFSDLLEFEMHLAALAACVLIFVESPGSIAELGCFAVMPQLKNKVLVVCEQWHASDENSFIFLGPMSSLRRGDKSSVQVFPLHTYEAGLLTPSDELVSNCWEDIEEALRRFVKRPVPESPFDDTAISHQLVLFAELVSLFGAMRKNEIAACALHFGCSVSPRELERCLKLLAKFNLIAIREWGNEKFYVRADDREFMLLRRPQGDDRPFDRLRFSFARNVDYQTSDPAKAKALRAYRKESVLR